MDTNDYKFAPLSRESEIPLYLQLEEQFKELIRLKYFDEDEPLPREVDIADKLGISRSVVRQAILNLVNAGYMYRIPGKGTYLTYPKVEYDLLGFYNFKKEVEDQGRELTLQIIDVNIKPADLSGSALFKIDTNENLVDIRRVLLVDGSPVILERTTIPQSKVKGITKEDVANDPYLKIFKKYGLEISTAKKYIEPGLANAFESKYLEISMGMPVMLIDRYTYEKEGTTVVARTKWTVRGDKCKYYININD